MIRATILMPRPKALPLICALTLALIASSCAPKAKTPERYETHFFAMDTIITIAAYGENAEEAMASAKAEILRIEALFDPENPDGELYAVNHGYAQDMSAEMTAVYDLAQSVYNKSGGALDPSVYAVVKAWGFIGGDTRIPSDAELQAAMEGMELTFGAVAKGYAAYAASGKMRELGIESAVLNLGGDIQAIGQKPDGSKWAVGVQDPNQPTGVSLGVLRLADTAVVTSGDYERYFEEDGVRYHHIIDPHTGYPANNGLRSVTVVTARGDVADALSTALFVLGEEGALEYLKEYGSGDIGLVLVTDDGRVIVTAALHDVFEEISGDYEYIYYEGA